MKIFQWLFEVQSICFQKYFEYFGNWEGRFNNSHFGNSIRIDWSLLILARTEHSFVISFELSILGKIIEMIFEEIWPSNNKIQTFDCFYFLEDSFERAEKWTITQTILN